MRVGFGFDAHAFDPSRTLVLGGVTILDSPGLAGHSDGDVLSHAVVDALLGAGGLGDLGTRFPGTERWRDASSLDMMGEAVELLRRNRWEVVNIDGTVVAESPRLADYRDAMRANVARALEIRPEDVSIKATTTDGLGFTGRGDGIAAYAVVLISKVAT